MCLRIKYNFLKVIPRHIFKPLKYKRIVVVKNLVFFNNYLLFQHQSNTLKLQVSSEFAPQQLNDFMKYRQRRNRPPDCLSSLCENVATFLLVSMPIPRSPREFTRAALFSAVVIAPQLCCLHHYSTNPRSCCRLRVSIHSHISTRHTSDPAQLPCALTETECSSAEGAMLINRIEGVVEGE